MIGPYRIIGFAVTDGYFYSTFKFFKKEREMGLLDKLRKPKWEHKDPTIRRQAVINLDAMADQEIIRKIAKTEQEQSIKQLAIKRVDDVFVLYDLWQDNPTGALEQTIRQRIIQLLGQQDQRIPMEKRTELLSLIGPGPLCEAICINSPYAQERLFLLEKISRDALLGDIASSDSDTEVRLAAFKKIESLSTLKRVLKAVKTKDRNLYTAAKQKIDAIEEQATRPQRMREAANELIEQLNRLCTRNDFDLLKLNKIKQQWQDLSDLEASTQADYAQLIGRFEEEVSAIEKKQAELASLNAQLEPQREQYRVLLNVLTLLQTDVLSKSDVNTFSVETVNEAIVDINEQWQGSQKLPEQEQVVFDSNFKRIVQTIQAHCRLLQQRSVLLQKLCSVEKNLASYQKVLPKNSNVIYQCMQQLEALSTQSQATDLLPKVNRLIDVCRELEQVSDQRELERLNLKEKFNSILLVVENCLSEGNMRPIGGHLRDMQSLLDELKIIDGAITKNTYRRYQDALEQYKKLSGWQRWANTPKKEQLCEQVEALIDSSESPVEIARLVKAARADWRAMGPVEKDSSEELWHRFQQACDKAYEPCKIYFEQQSTLRDQNRQARQEFLDELEIFVQKHDWDKANWKKIERLPKELREQWSHFGITEKKYVSGFNKRFNHLVQAISQRIQREWSKNLVMKNQLIDEVKALLALEDLAFATQQAKTLQKKWQSLGRVSQKQERAMWKEMRKVFDELFAQRDQEKQSQLHVESQLMQAKQQLLRQLEELMTTINLSKKEFLRELDRLKQEWRALASSSANEFVVLEKQFSSLLAQSKQKLIFFDKRSELDEIRRLRDKMLLCLQLKSIAKTDKPESHRFETITNDWQKLKVEKPSTQEKVLDEYFDDLLQALDNKTPLDDCRLKLSTEITKAKICLQMEVLLGLETPSDFSRERMQYKVDLFSNQRKSDLDKDLWQALIDMESDWYVIGVLESTPDELCEKRRDKIIAKLRPLFAGVLDHYH